LQPGRFDVFSGRPTANRIGCTAVEAMDTILFRKFTGVPYSFSGTLNVFSGRCEDAAFYTRFRAFSEE
jgi:hypothetical protein